jgi:hypothetical protein
MFTHSGERLIPIMDPQQSNEQAASALGGRSLLWIFGLFAVSLLLGALLAAPVFNFVLWLGRNFQSLESLRDVEFFLLCLFLDTPGCGTGVVSVFCRMETGGNGLAWDC